MASGPDEALFNIVSRQYGFGNSGTENNLTHYEPSFPPFSNVTTYYSSGLGGGGGGPTQAPPAHVGNLTSQGPWHCPSLVMISNNGVNNCSSGPPQTSYGYPAANYYHHHPHSGYTSYSPSYYPQLTTAATNEFLNQPLNLSDSKVISSPSLVHRQPYFNPYSVGGVVAAGPSSALALSEFRTSPIHSAYRHPCFETEITEIENYEEDESFASSDGSESETSQMPNSLLVKSRMSAFETVLPGTSTLNKDFMTSSSLMCEEDTKIDELPSFSDILTTTTTTSGLEANVSSSEAPVVRTPDSSEKLPKKRSKGRPKKSETKSSQQKGNFTKEQVQILEERFDDYPFIRNANERKVLAAKLKVTEHRITVWFQNRRSKERRNGVLPKGTLPSSYFK